VTLSIYQESKVRWLHNKLTEFVEGAAAGAPATTSGAAGAAG
jgi:hypothetical protein